MIKSLMSNLTSVFIICLGIGFAAYIWSNETSGTKKNAGQHEDYGNKIQQNSENIARRASNGKHTGRDRRRSSEDMLDLYHSYGMADDTFITVDFVLNSYCNLQGDLLKELETREFMPLLKKLSSGLYVALDNEKHRGKGSDMALAYSAVLCSLAGVERPPTDSVSSTVAAELKLIMNHAGVGISPVTGDKIDYTQFTPLGYYTETEELKSYFRAMIYAGLVDFHLKESASTGVTKEMADEQTAAAVRISGAVSADEELDKVYRRLEDKLRFFVGSSDDLGVSDYAGFDPDGTSNVRAAILAAAIKNGRLPRISGYYEAVKEKPDESPAVLTAGFRLIGQRYSPESEAIQMVVYPNVKEYNGVGNPFTMTEVLANGSKGVRGFPTLLDIPAGLGSKKAGMMIQKRGDADYSGYKEAMLKASGVLQSSAKSPSSLADRNLRLVGLLVKRDTPAALNASIGFWSRQRHNIMLYVKKPSYAVGISDKQPMAFIEDMPEVYAYIVDCLARIEAEVDDSDIKTKIVEFTSSMEKIVEITDRQDAGKATLDDREYLNHLAGLWIRIIRRNGPIVCDIFTEHNSGMVLEAGVGKPVQVTKEIGGVSLTGYRMSVYEFKQPMDSRLTDEDWCNMLEEGKATGRLVFQ